MLINVFSESIIMGNESILEDHIYSLINGSQFSKSLNQYLNSVSSLGICAKDDFPRFRVPYVTPHFLLFNITNILEPRQIKYQKVINKNPLDLPQYITPAYALSLDQPIAVIYWSDYNSGRIPFYFQLYEIFSKSDSNTSIIFEPSNETKNNTYFSVYNLSWPGKSVSSKNFDSSSNLILEYFYNSLLPPMRDDSKIWYEFPILHVLSKEITIFSVSKTLAIIPKFDNSSDTFTVNFITDCDNSCKDFSKIKKNAKIPRSCSLYIYKYINSMSKNIILPSILIKEIKIYAGEKNYYLIPLECTAFNSIYHSGNNDDKIIITALSILLKKLYINSPDPLKFTIDESTLLLKINKLLTLLGLQPLSANLKLSHIYKLLKSSLIRDLYELDKNNSKLNFLYNHPLLLELYIQLLGIKISNDVKTLFQLSNIIYNYATQGNYLQPKPVDVIQLNSQLYNIIDKILNGFQLKENNLPKDKNLYALINIIINNLISKLKAWKRLRYV